MPLERKYEWEREDYNEANDPFIKHIDENGNFIENPEGPEDNDTVEIKYHYRKNTGNKRERFQWILTGPNRAIVAVERLSTGIPRRPLRHSGTLWFPKVEAWPYDPQFEGWKRRCPCPPTP